MHETIAPKIEFDVLHRGMNEHRYDQNEENRECTGDTYGQRPDCLIVDNLSTVSGFVLTDPYISNERVRE